MLQIRHREEIRDYPEIYAALVNIVAASLRSMTKLGLIEKEKSKVFEQEFLYRESLLNQLPIGKIDIYRCWGPQLLDSFAESVVTYLNSLPGSQTRPWAKKDLTLSIQTFPLLSTVKEIVVFDALKELIEFAIPFAESLATKSEEFAHVVKCYRADLQDSIPITLDREFLSYADGIRRNISSIESELTYWNNCSIGVSDAGTTVGIVVGFKEKFLEELSVLVGRSFINPSDYLDEFSAVDRCLLAHAHVQAMGVVVWKIARNLVFQCSGPRGGIHEITFPSIAPGSSIMPGKVNPTVGELAASVADKISANHLAISESCHCGILGRGSFSVIPVKSILESCRLLSRTMKVFDDKVISGITAHPEQCQSQALRSTALCDLLIPAFGNKVANEVKGIMISEGLSVVEASIKQGLLSPAEASVLFDLQRLSTPA